ncbi:MAG: hypothetical protein ACRDD3_12795, partial [Azovibrio sp.]
HAPAIVLALIPNIAEWARSQISSTLTAAGVNASSVPPEIMASLESKGVLFHGMAITGGGAVLGGLLLGAIAAFVIDRRFNWAAVYAFVATFMSFFGFIHSEHLAFNATPSVSLGYGMATVIFACLAWKQMREEGKLDWTPIDNGSEPIH